MEMGTVAFAPYVGGLDLFTGVVTTLCLHLMAVQVTCVKQIGGFRPMVRQAHLNIQDPSWQKYVRIIPTRSYSVCALVKFIS